ncbi:MAG: chaperone TorD involved in molybdoenzyme TorA maturation [Candidatus Kentron sp. G]|nr:MAG: chaperone TorD involved in molybdoenzyme TorA maturation [Candidatus Kentron sp. G]VFM96684.1 MAG: chaperone TorD involved in molybdoenzyme TorA maturation [Candidatus Kentron sp. G]VFM98149.1 MAG: chaperone TorD involved in molybdoenzyme TorA maturation [Candidatus Kentron sp. G]
MRLLAGLLAAPEEDSLSVLAELAKEHVWLREAAAELAEVGLPHWQTEHTGLFISNYPKTICPPFESAYRSGSMEGVAAQELTELYLRIDLKVEDVPADYLGAILECAAYLLEMPEPPDDGLWRELWDQHVVSWVPRFADDILGMKNCLLLYRQLAHRLLLSISSCKSSSGKPAS